jgi:hypothetical protein
MDFQDYERAKFDLAAFLRSAEHLIQAGHPDVTGRRKPR